MSLPSLLRRRLPIYVLADRSGSMAGDPIAALGQGLRRLQRDLLQDARAREWAWLGLISFGTHPRLDVPLTALRTFRPPQLSAGGSSPLGGALALLARAISADQATGAGQGFADYRPIVFLFSDGQATDAYGEALAALGSTPSARPGRIVGVTCGGLSDSALMRAIANPVVALEDMGAGDFQQLLTLTRSQGAV